MRTIALTLLGAGLVAAADAAKPPALAQPLGTAERLALQDLIARRGEIEKQINQIVSEGCAQRGLSAQRCRLREDGAFVETPAPPPPAPPKPEEKK